MGMYKDGCGLMMKHKIMTHHTCFINTPMSHVYNLGISMHDDCFIYYHFLR